MKVTLYHKDGRTVTCSTLDVIGWAYHGFYPKDSPMLITEDIKEQVIETKTETKTDIVSVKVKKGVRSKT